MKPGMMISTGRQLTVGPMLQKSLKLLQMNSLDFARELQTFAETNPLLELEELADDIADQTGEQDGGRAAQNAAKDATEYWGATPGTSHSHHAATDLDWIAQIPERSDLRTHLKTQVTDLLLSAKLESACLAVIESIDERGYLEDIPSVLGRHFRDLGLPASDALVQEALALVQSLEPAGVGALDLKDCLKLQLTRMPDTTPALDIAKHIAAYHLEQLGQGNAKAIARETGESIEDVRSAISLIKTLNPSPGRDFDTERVDYIMPELAVYKVQDQWRVRSLHGPIPKVRVNKIYADILAKQGVSPTNQPIKDQLHEARWLVKNMEQREQTIFAVGQAIVARQSAYFSHGEIALVPMTLADIAADIDMHESTVSRVVSSKYLVCPAGLKPMKMFFTSHVHTSSGDSCSASAVKAMIQAIINDEPADTPYSDHKLAQLLARRGVKIARRTVSKYRQAIGLRSFELRRRSDELLNAA